MSTIVFEKHDASSNVTAQVVKTDRGFGALLRDDDVNQIVGCITFYSTLERARAQAEGYVHSC